MTRISRSIRKGSVRSAVLAATLAATPVQAEMVLSQVIVDMKPDAPAVQDVEIWNDGAERLYVAVDPARIDDPGGPGEARVAEPDPAARGLLVAPQRLVLEPAERRIVRVAAMSERGPRDAVYRLAIRPVAGAIGASGSALKVFVGYDALVLVRPAKIAGEVTGVRQGRLLTLRNESNTAQEVYDGKQCAGDGEGCRALPAKRLYAGASWAIELPYDGSSEFAVTDGTTSRRTRFP